MRTTFIIAALFIGACRLYGQEDTIVLPAPQILDIESLIAETMMHNPEILAAEEEMNVLAARIPQATALENPRLQYMREAMPGFRLDQPMDDRLELMQTFRFPTKLSAQGDLADIRAEHAHHTHQEKINDVVDRLREAYAELWFVQQNIVLNRENIRLLKQFTDLARTKYSVGQVPQQDVLKAQVELAMTVNESIALRQQELSAKAMLMAILNRGPKDTLGYAVIPEEVVFDKSLDSLRQLAPRLRPMLIHDSLMIVESETELSLARQEKFLPDFDLGLERMTSTTGGPEGWSIRAGVTIPFSPWTLGKGDAMVDEAQASIREMTAMYAASRNMVLSDVSDLWYKADAAKRQLDMYRAAILPQTRQALDASRSGYQGGTTGFLVLIDAYRTSVNLTREYFMTRMRFDQTVARLMRAVGSEPYLRMP